MNGVPKPHWTTRIARADDLPAMVRLQVETWRAEYAGWLEPDFLDGRFEQHCRERLGGMLANSDRFCRTLVAERAAGYCGFVAFGAAHRRAAEIFSMSVAPDERGRGLGELLLAGARAELAAQGLAPVHVCVLEQNIRAQAFYRRLGAIEERRADFALNGRRLREIVYRSS